LRRAENVAEEQRHRRMISSLLLDLTAKAAAELLRFKAAILP
jgi:hypothetical protein